jgi:hypothetical protein
MLQPNSLKFESCKFSIIINIINITFESGVAHRLNVSRYNFVERLTLLDFNFFDIFYTKKLTHDITRGTFIVIFISLQFLWRQTCRIYMLSRTHAILLGIAMFFVFLRINLLNRTHLLLG